MFTQFHTISHNCHPISCNFGYFSHFLENFNMLGIKMHVLELRNSMMILSHTFTHSLTQFHAIFTQFHATFRQFQAISDISAIFGTISTCWVSKYMSLSWEFQWWYFHTLSCTPLCNWSLQGLNAYCAKESRVVVVLRPLIIMATTEQLGKVREGLGFGNFSSEYFFMPLLSEFICYNTKLVVLFFE